MLNKNIYKCLKQWKSRLWK